MVEFPVAVVEAGVARVAVEVDRAQIDCSQWHTDCSRWHKRRLGFVQEPVHKPEPGGPCHTCIVYSPRRSAAG